MDEVSGGIKLGCQPGRGRGGCLCMILFFSISKVERVFKLVCGPELEGSFVNQIRHYLLIVTHILYVQ